MSMSYLLINHYGIEVLMFFLLQTSHTQSPEAICTYKYISVQT